MKKAESLNSENNPMKKMTLKMELDKLKIEYKKWEGDREKRIQL